jgi:small subunit ribosomal protein S20e
MADYQKEDLDKAGAPAAKIHKIRITLTSRNVKPLEKCTWGKVSL